MSRTPPLHIDREAISGIAAMEPAVSGRLLSWGWRTFEGERVLIAQERGRDPEAIDALIAGSSYLDRTALQDGLIVVEAFESARVRAAEISRKRAEARLARFEQSDQHDQGAGKASASRLGTIQGTKQDRSSPQIEGREIGPLFASVEAGSGHRPEGITDSFEADRTLRESEDTGEIPVHGPSIQAAIGDLVDAGMDVVEAHKLIGRLAINHAGETIASATLRMRGREVANPARYLERTLDNDRLQGRTASGPTVASCAASGSARPVKRIVPGQQTGDWAFIGWTSRDHAKSDGTSEGRFMVWRTDTGKLSYKRPGPDEQPPTFEAEPGVYEID